MSLGDLRPASELPPADALRGAPRPACWSRRPLAGCGVGRCRVRVFVGPPVRGVPAMPEQLRVDQHLRAAVPAVPWCPTNCLHGSGRAPGRTRPAPGRRSRRAPDRTFRIAGCARRAPRTACGGPRRGRGRGSGRPIGSVPAPRASAAPARPAPRRSVPAVRRQRAAGPRPARSRPRCCRRRRPRRRLAAARRAGSGLFAIRVAPGTSAAHRAGPAVPSCAMRFPASSLTTRGGSPLERDPAFLAPTVRSERTLWSSRSADGIAAATHRRQGCAPAAGERRKPGAG